MSLQPYEREFEERLFALERDSRQAAVFAYTEFTIHHQAGSNFDLVDRLNLHGTFWNAVQQALLGSALVALGRMFDEDRDTHNIDGLLRYAEEKKGLFSRRALADRKVASGLSPAEAQVYVAGAWELPSGGLSTLRDEFEAKHKFFKEKVRPIRNRVLAHTERITQEVRDSLFTDLFMRPFEELIVFTLRLHRAMSQLYHDGRRPVLDQAPTNIVEVMKSLPEQGTSTWEHLHAAKDASACLDWIRSASLEK